MPRLYLTFLQFLILAPSILHSQQSPEDSIQNILCSTIPDSTRAVSLNDLSWVLFLQGDYHESKQIVQEAIALANSSVNNQDALWLKRKAKSLSIAGIIDCVQGDYSGALIYNTEALKIREALLDTIAMADSYTTMGVIYWSLGRYPEAFENYFAALKIYETAMDVEGIGRINNNIGGIYEYKGEYDEALKHYLIALDKRKLIDDKDGTAAAYNNIGNIYDYKLQYKESLLNHFKALDLYKSIGQKQGMANVYDNIANTYSHQENYTEELKYRNASMLIKEEMGDKLGIATSYYNIGASFESQHEFDKANQYFLQGLLISKEIGARDRIMEAYEGLAKVSAARKEYKKALEYYQSYSSMKDSLNNEENTEKIAEMKVKYESDKKDTEIALLHNQKQLFDETIRQRKLVRIIISSGCVILLLFAFVSYRDTQLLEVEKIRNKLSKDLHDDIGSTLSSISINSTYVEKMTTKLHPDVTSAIHDIGESARSAMENMSDIVWAINPKNETFKNMIDRFEVFAQQILGAKNIRLHISVIDPLLGKKLSLPQRKNLYLILKESINNIAKYSSAKNCYVSTSSHKKTIYLKIEDDGLGFDEHAGGQCGNGLVNMKTRARELNAEFSIASEKSKGTVVTIKFLSWI